MKLLRNLTIIILLYISYYSYHNFFSINTIVGNYVVKSQNIKPFLAETPYGDHFLKLNEDFTFKSSYWGNGTYEFFSDIKGASIRLSYDDGRSSYSCFMKRQYFSSPRIILDIDMNHYMEKEE